MSIAELLVSHGYIASATKKGRGAKRVIDITLKEEPAIHGIRFVSTPSRSIYAGYRKIRPVKGGHGMAVLTTSYGILTGEMARKQKVGGKVLFEIW
jgi:small subunit ribosomal protein S8